MKFRNTRNGRILELADNFSGKYWEPIEKSVPKKPEKTGDQEVDRCEEEVR